MKKTAVLILVLLSISVRLQAKDLNYYKSQYKNKFPVLALSNVCPEHLEMDLVQSITRELLKSRRFDEIVETAKLFRKKESRFRDGEWKLAIFIKASDPKHIIRKWGYWEKIFIKFCEEYKNDPTPYILYSKALINYAWSIRSNSFGHLVSSEQWKGFKKYIAQAKKVLLDNKAVAQKCPGYYGYLLLIARAESWSVTQFDPVYEEGRKKYKDFHLIYKMKLCDMFPRWGGSVEKVNKTLAEAVNYTKDEYGSEYYTRLFLYLKRFHKEPTFEMFDFDWEKFKKGYFDIVKRFPESSMNKNNFAYYACQFKDKKTAKLMFDKIGDDIDLKVWESKPNFIGYKSWANK